MRVSFEQWDVMAPGVRNRVIASILGLELLGQWYIHCDGKPWLATPYSREQKKEAEKLFKRAGTKRGWKVFTQAHGLPETSKFEDWKLTLELVEWPLRYSDTPGGGWEVIETLRKKGFEINIRTVHNFLQFRGWKITVSEIDGAIVAALDAETIQEVACLAALKIFGQKGDQES